MGEFKVLNSSGALKSVGSTGAAGATGATGADGASGLGAWEGHIAAAFGDGNPVDMIQHLMRAGNTGVTPAQMTTTLARVSYFRLRTALTVNKIRYWGGQVVTGAYRIAIYNGDTLARVLTETTFDTPAAAWGEIGSSLGLALSANQLYFLAVAVSSGASGNVGVTCFGQSATATNGALNALPKSWPGNLDADAGYIGAGFAGGAVTAGALPDPFPTVAAQAWTTGGMPMFFLDNSNA